MTRRLLTSVVLISAALGCRTTSSSTSNAPPPVPGQSRLAKAFSSSSTPGKTQPEVVDNSDANKPLKSSTVAVFADLQVEAAFAADELPPAERDRRLDEARLKYQRALEQEPGNFEALRGLARLYTRIGDKDRSAAAYKNALQHHQKNASLAHEAAMSFGRFDDWQTALSLWEHALSLDPANRKYPRMIGIAQSRLGNFEAGFASLVKVCSEAEARTVMARELIDAGQVDQGRQQLELALKADPGFAMANEIMTNLNGVQPAAFKQ